MIMLRNRIRLDCRTIVVGILSGLLAATPGLTALPVSSPERTSAVGDPSVAPAVTRSGARAALELEKLSLENRKLALEIENSRRNPFSWRGLLNLIYTNGAIIIAVLGGLWGFYTYLHERRKERLESQESRFEKIVEGLGGATEQERIGAAVLLPTFLRKGYERFFTQVFNLAAGNLRQVPFQEQLYSSAAPGQPRQELPSAALRQTLVTVMCESYPLARGRLERENPGARVDVQRSLNAEGILLPGAYLGAVDFRCAWLRGANLRNAGVKGADFTGANLEGSDLSGANLAEANLRDANLKAADLEDADLEHADLSGSRLEDATLRGARLRKAQLVGVTLSGVDFRRADLREATISDVDFAGHNLSRRETNIAEAYLDGASLTNVRGLDDDQLRACLDAGAIIADRADLGEGTSRGDTPRLPLLP